jgi:hypothetical protein
MFPRETGVGKELVGHALHHRCPRSGSCTTPHSMVASRDKLVTFKNFTIQLAFAVWQTGHKEFQPAN